MLCNSSQLWHHGIYPQDLVVSCIAIPFRALLLRSKHDMYGLCWFQYWIPPCQKVSHVVNHSSVLPSCTLYILRNNLLWVQDRRLLTRRVSPMSNIFAWCDLHSSSESLTSVTVVWMGVAVTSCNANTKAMTQGSKLSCMFQMCEECLLLQKDGNVQGCLPPQRLPGFILLQRAESAFEIIAKRSLYESHWMVIY